jgi:hypothetical protein
MKQHILKTSNELHWFDFYLRVQLFENNLLGEHWFEIHWFDFYLRVHLKFSYGCFHRGLEIVVHISYYGTHV